MVEVGRTSVRADERVPRVRERGKLALGLMLAVLVVILDQMTKNFALQQFPPGGATERVVTSFFNLVLVGNRGVSFGMFNDDGGRNAILFSIIALVICAILAVWLARTWRTLLAVGIGFVIGGAVGNVIDRVRLGSVVDFLDFHAGAYHWPAFNVADAAICFGVLLMLIDGFRDRPARADADADDQFVRAELPAEEDLVPMGAELPRNDRRLKAGLHVSPDTPETGLLLRPGRPMRTDVIIPAAAPPMNPPPATRPVTTPVTTGHGNKHLTPRPGRPTTTGGPYGA